MGLNRLSDKNSIYQYNLLRVLLEATGFSFNSKGCKYEKRVSLVKQSEREYSRTTKVVLKEEKLVQRRLQTYVRVVNSPVLGVHSEPFFLQ